MALRISYCPYRLLFKRPFGTAHGLRDGTDSLFIRLEEDGIAGYGEVTLPPYLKETIAGAQERLISIVQRKTWTANELMTGIDGLTEFHASDVMGSRAGLHLALIDLIGKRTQRSARQLLEVEGDRQPITLMTIGICPIEEVAERLHELPPSGALKLKVGDPEAKQRITAIKSLDNRSLFLDANQGLRSASEANALLETVGDRELRGLEQPFETALEHLGQELTQSARCDLYGDESIQSVVDISAKQHLFNGVNVKLMKCGGLDRAWAMIKEAKRLGLKVMLGSMSESSLGCTAMAQLACAADIADLDGPWLISNDPFEGVGMENRRLSVPERRGHGALPRDGFELGYVCA